jgi:hypothetical protein
MNSPEVTSSAGMSPPVATPSIVGTSVSSRRALSGAQLRADLARIALRRAFIADELTREVASETPELASL